MPKNDLLLRAARRESTPRTPVWLMRQAGRFDPRYRALKERIDLPLEAMFRDVDVATEISLLPMRFGVDAIIFFQDILTPLAPMGAEFVFRPGPVLTNPIRSQRDVEALRPADVTERLGFVTETIRQLKATIGEQLPILGFAGAPLTLAMFLIEGGSPGPNPPHAAAMIKNNRSLFHRLLGSLADMTVDYLTMQIEAGADAVQLFESCADLVSAREYEEFAHRYHVRIFQRLDNRVPRILFAKEQPAIELMAASGADVISLGKCVDLARAKRLVGHKVAIQGNVDNRLLATGSEQDVEEAVRHCVSAGANTGHILNLNHGLLQQTPEQNVRRFIETCHATRVPSRDAVATSL